MQEAEQAGANRRLWPVGLGAKLLVAVDVCVGMALWVKPT